LIVIRACGHADAPTVGEPRSRAAIQQAYGIDHELSDAELLDPAERWRPFRTWVSVMMRALWTTRHDDVVPEGATVWQGR
jgi:DNA-3-methyladenine glycosylase II